MREDVGDPVAWALLPKEEALGSAASLRPAPIGYPSLREMLCEACTPCKAKFK